MNSTLKCNNCGKNIFETHTKTKCSWSKIDLNIVICKSCNLVFSHPKPDKSLGTKYFNDAYSNAPGFESHSYYRDHDKILIRNKKRFELVNKISPPNSNVLDFGAGQGYFMKVCRDNGWKVVGTEHSTAAVNSAKQLFNIDILNSTENLPKNYFGVITLWDVIEHLQHPKEVLLELSNFLHKDGMFILETSNIDSYDYLIKKRRWSYWDVDHYYYYSLKTIKYLLDSIDFEVATIDTKNVKLKTSFKQKIKRIIRILINVKDYWKKVKSIYYLIFKKGFSNNSLMTVVAKRKVIK